MAVSTIQNQASNQTVNGGIHHYGKSDASIPTARFPIHDINIAENHSFVGRENELQHLYKSLVVPQSRPYPISCAICGFGGVGKTQTALKFLYKNRECFDAVFWVSADPEKETEVLRSFGATGRKLKLFDTDDIDQAKLELILEWLKDTDKRWLLIFDNVADYKHIQPYWPTVSKAQSAIVVTSQVQVEFTNCRIPLEPFDSTGGSDLLLDCLRLSDIGEKDPRRALAKEVAKLLGGSPLYINHAAGFMALSNSDLKEYREDFLADSSMLVDTPIPTLWRYERPISATHDGILKILTEDAKGFLFVLALMNPDHISESLLCAKHGCTDIAFLNDRTRYRKVVAELNMGRLAQLENGGDLKYLTVHRATQTAMLAKMNRDPLQRDATFTRVINLLRDSFPPPSKLQQAEAHVWPRIVEVLPHLQSLLSAFERANPRMKGNLAFAELLSDVGGMDLYDRGRVLEAYRLSNKAEELLDTLSMPLETPLRGDVLTVIGLCTDFMSLEKRLEGLKIREKCQRVRKLCHEAIPTAVVALDDNIRLYNSYMDLVCSQQQFNDFENVEKNCEECLVQYKKWDTDEEKIPYEYAKYYNHMAYVLLYKGDSAKAVEYAKRGYELAEKATPGAQLAVLYKYDWANILFQHGAVEESLEEHQKMLKILKTDCGKANIRTMKSRLNIGIIHYFMGNMDAARKHLEKAIHVLQREIEAPEDSVRAKYYLSQALKQQNPSSEEAAILEQESKASLHEILQKDRSGKAAAYHADYPALFDYIVQWECRLVTPRRSHDFKEPTSLEQAEHRSSITYRRALMFIALALSVGFPIVLRCSLWNLLIWYSDKALDPLQQRVLNHE